MQSLKTSRYLRHKTSEQKGEPMEFKNAEESFEQAIRSGRLSENENATNYAGLYMYMGHSNSVALFKNIETRKYLK